MTEKPLYINEFAKALGISRETVRNYQTRGVLPDRRNPVNNYRIFTQEDLHKMMMLHFGKTEKPNER